jgi:hypothetical protein
VGRRTRAATPGTVQTVSVTATLTFDALIDVITRLPHEQKCQLLEMLEQQIDQAEANWELAPEARSGIDEARREIESGDSVTLEEYLARRRAEG